MQQESDLSTGKLKIFDKFDIVAVSGEYNSTPTFATIGSEYIISMIDLERVEKLSLFRYDTLGMTTTRYLNNFYRISRDGNRWSEWLPLNRDFDGFPPIDPLDPLHVDIKWVRGGSSEIGSIRLLEYLIAGDLYRAAVDDGSAIRLEPGKEAVMSAPFIYKVFSISDMEILSSSDLSGVEVKYRFTQDSCRSWSQWELLTSENIKTVRINPIRFFQIEYLIRNNSSSNVYIQDINLIGDFQNVSKDYFKSNLMGIRECCQSGKVGYMDANGNWIDGTSSTGSLGNAIGGAACSTDGSGSALPKMTGDEKASLYNPYQQNTAMSLLNKLSDDAQQVFGHKVIYFATDPDKRGQDHTLNEYQLYNVSCEGEVKVSVDGNNFPDSQISMNQFDLSLFESMEVHITKQQFKEVFGPQRRPAKEDFLYFCDVNRMYSVDHAQQFRNFNNAAVYYKLHLKKYNKSANVRVDSPEVENRLNQLTKNSTIDELFGTEIAQDKASIANKDQLKTLSKDPIRLEYKAEIDKELIENSSTIISKSHYDLGSVDYGTVAVRYKNMDPFIRKSDNIGFMMWFSLNNYVIDEEYSFFSCMDSSQGWKTSLKNDHINVVANGVTYSWALGGTTQQEADMLLEETWYCYVLNIDQRNRKIEQYIYKRDSESEEAAASLISTMLRMVYRNEMDFDPVEFEIGSGTSMILGSDMKATNIRLFSAVIPEKAHNKLLNQYIIGDDSKYLVFADNANTRIYLNNFPLNE